MDTAIVTAMAGIAIARWWVRLGVRLPGVTQRALSKRKLVRTEIRRRETFTASP